MVNENTDTSEPEEFHEDNDPSPKVVKMNYPANSHRSKMGKSEPPAAKDPKEAPEKGRLDKVIKGDVVQRKKGLGHKIADTFKGDDVNSVGDYVLFQVILPSAKAMLSEAVSQGVERLLFGSSARASRPASTTRYAQYTPYNRVSTAANPAGRAGEADGPRPISGRARATHDFSEVILETRGEAEMVLDALGDAISQYEVVTVQDYYDLVGITGTFTDQKWGWTSIAGSRISRAGRDGFIIELPKTQPID